MRNVLPTKDQLFSRRVAVVDKCPICNAERETVYHSLVSCQFAKQCWGHAGINLAGDEQCSFYRWISEAFQNCNAVKMQDIFMLCWTIWRNRNSIVWNQRGEEFSEVCKSAKLQLNQWKNAQDKSFDNFLGFMSQEDGKERWECPQEGTIKINVDATLFETSNTYCYSMIARDHKGELIVAGTKCREVVLIQN